MADASQWLFPITALRVTPSEYPLDVELYNRARGIEFLFRLGSSLALSNLSPTSAMCTAATWFHRFYMRYSMLDYHRQDVAAACIFLATKTEECGRKLRDVARVCQAKIQNIDVNSIPPDGKDVEQCQATILSTEEVLLEALCFDFVVENPHAELVNIFDAVETDPLIQEYSWSLAHDSYRTPLSILYPPKIIATACYVLAQRIYDGPNSPSLDARISATAPSMSLPTPPTHKPPSPDATRFAIEYFQLSENELASVAATLFVLLDFYRAQDTESLYPYISAINSVHPPSLINMSSIYAPFTQMAQPTTAHTARGNTVADLSRTPNSTHGDHTPVKVSIEVDGSKLP